MNSPNCNCFTKPESGIKSNSCLGKILSRLLVLLVLPPLAFSESKDEESMDFALEEVVVTAQRREESIADVPLSVTAINAEDMKQARLENIANIAAVTPSVQFNSTNIASSSANIIIRGLGTVGNSRTFEGGVGVFVDGVYRTRSGAVLESFLDMEGLQVLRGPQGTLFGKNTSAGTVLLSSSMPTFEGVNGSYDVGAGNYGRTEVQGAINIPISEVAALRIAGLYNELDGYVEDINRNKDINGKDTSAVKLQLLIKPTEKLSFRFIADYLESDGQCCYGTVDFEDGAVTAITDALALAGGNKLPSKKLSDYEAGMNHPAQQDVTDKGLVWHIDYDVWGGTLRSISAYREYEVAQKDADADFHSVDILKLDESFESEFISQEFTFHGQSEALSADYIVGLFLSDEDITMDRNIYWGSDAQAYYDITLNAAIGLPIGTISAPVGLWADEAMEATAESIAVFGHSDFSLNEQWNVIVGLRYSEEEKTGEFDRDFFDLQVGTITDPSCAALGLPSPCTLPLNPFTLAGVQPGPSYSDKTIDRAFSGTLSLQYRPNDKTMWYLSYNHGFKAGGVTVDANAAGSVANNPLFGGTPGDPTYEPEKVDAYELGVKTTYWSGRARTNVALYYNDIEDLQVAQFEGLKFTIINADSAKTYGLEVENLMQLTETLTGRLDVNWLPYAKYGEDDSISTVLSDQRMRRAPHVSANTGLDVNFPLADDLALTGRLSYQYRSSHFIGTSVPDAKDGHLGLVHANLGFRNDSQGWLVEVWGQNLTDENYPATIFNSPGQAGDTNAYVGAPRTYGITLRGEF